MSDTPREAPATEANVQRAIHPVPRQPTEPHACKEPEACDLILEAKQHILAIEAAARDEGRQEAVRWKDVARDLRGAVSNLPEAYGGFGLVRRTQVDDAIVTVLQRWVARHGRSSDPEPAPLSREHRVPPDLTDDPEGEHCYDCGRAVGVWWHAPDDLWAALTGRPEGGGLLCIRCFDNRARVADVLIQWVPKVERRAVPALQATGEPTDEEES